LKHLPQTQRIAAEILGWYLKETSNFGPPQYILIGTEKDVKFQAFPHDEIVWHKMCEVAEILQYVYYNVSIQNPDVLEKLAKLLGDKSEN
jgi:hypothetical protein